MKQKRTFVTILLVLALLCLGIAYAAFSSDELQISGTATASVAEGNVDVEFVAVSPEKTEGVTTYGEIDSLDPDKASFTVAELATVGDTKTVTFTIENKTQNGVPVILETPTITWANGTSENEWYEVSYEYGNTNLAAATEDGDSTTLTVTVKLLKTISTPDTQTAANTDNTVTITLKANAANN